MLTEFTLYAFRRDTIDWYSRTMEHLPPPSAGPYSVQMMYGENAAMWCNVDLWYPEDREELLVMATGWESCRVRIGSPEGYLLANNHPMSWYVGKATDMATGFMRSQINVGSNRGPGTDLITVMLTARRHA